MSGSVSDELTCPDCGGHIGGGGGPGTKPCSCFTPTPSRPRPRVDEPDPVDMRPNRSGGGETKVCRFCGKDLTGRARMKDELGYVCKKCSDEDFAVQDEREKDLIRCPECEQKKKPTAFVEYRGTLICRACHQYHMENDKLKVGKVKLTKHKEHDKKTVITLAIVFGVLLLILLIKTFLF